VDGHPATASGNEVGASTNSGADAGATPEAMVAMGADRGLFSTAVAAGDGVRAWGPCATGAQAPTSSPTAKIGLKAPRLMGAASEPESTARSGSGGRRRSQ
jgi:hypothetical protein